jgi:nicotinate-nucleotide adenylyltransferase
MGKSVRGCLYTSAVAEVTERLGIFGGTFDPVHVGHLVAALEARDQLTLDRVMLVVAGDPWQKQGRVVASAEARLEMVQAAIDGVAGLEASRLEIDRRGSTFTIDTVEHLAANGRELFLIVGADVASRLDGWHRADELRALVTVAIVRRATEIATAHLEGWRHVGVSMVRLDVSSTELRDRVARGAPLDFLVPAGAIRVIRERRLYTPA